MIYIVTKKGTDYVLSGGNNQMAFPNLVNAYKSIEYATRAMRRVFTNEGKSNYHTLSHTIKVNDYVDFYECSHSLEFGELVMKTKKVSETEIDNLFK